MNAVNIIMLYSIIVVIAKSSLWSLYIILQKLPTLVGTFQQRTKLQVGSKVI